MNDVANIARRWIGTPYVHQASVQGAGCDCLGLIRGIWREVYGREPAKIPAYSADWDEPQGTEALWQAAKTHLRSVDGAWRTGQVLLFRMRSQAVAKHLGILAESADKPTFIHAYTGHGVVENSLSDPWRRRIVARFEFQKG